MVATSVCNLNTVLGREDFNLHHGPPPNDVNSFFLCWDVPWHLLRFRAAWLPTELKWVVVRQKLLISHEQGWAEDFKASCQHSYLVVKSLHVPYTTFIIFFFPPSPLWNLKCLLLLLCQKIKEQHFFSQSDGEVIMWIWWWELQRPFLKKLTKAWVSALFVILGLCLAIFPSFSLLFVTPDCFVDQRAMKLKYVDLEWVKLSASRAEILTHPSFVLLRS